MLLLENLRFHKEEEKNDEAFAKQLASLCDFYVNDAFGAAHRAHASTAGITKHVAQAAAGLLMQKNSITLVASSTLPNIRLLPSWEAQKVSIRFPSSMP